MQRTGLYPGLDVVYYGHEGQLEYDLVVAPEADPGRIRMRIEGADSLALTRSGDLVLRTPAGDLVQRKPVAYQLIDGKRRPVDARFRLRDGEVSFALGTYRRDRQLIIDPTLVYATYFAESPLSLPFNNAATVDSTGHLIITGTTTDTSFPVQSGSYDTTYNGGGDVFVVKLTQAGDGRVFSTYLGGSGSDSALAVAVGPYDAIYVAGTTTSSNFSNFVGTDRASNVPQAFVAELNAGGTGLVYATSFGGNDTLAVAYPGDGGTNPYAISVDRDGNVYIAGHTTSAFLPVTPGAFQKSYLGGYTYDVGGGDGFAAILNSAGSSFLMCTYLGGPAADHAFAVANDASGNIYLAGDTYGSFPTTSGTVQSSAPPGAGFVAKLNSSGGRVWATYLTSGVIALAVDDSSNVYGAGFTSDPSFPTTSGAFRRTLSGVAPYNDVFVVKLNSTASAFLYSTFLGGSGNDYATALKIDSAGNAYVTGGTDAICCTGNSNDFPTTANAFQRTFAGSSDAFLSVLNATGTGLLYSTYYGGNSGDSGRSVALDSSNNVYIAGSTTSTNLPFKNGVQSTPGPIFMAKFSAVGNGTGTPAVSVAISPTSTMLAPGQTQQFSATVLNTTNTAVKCKRQSKPTYPGRNCPC